MTMQPNSPLATSPSRPRGERDEADWAFALAATSEPEHVLELCLEAGRGCAAVRGAAIALVRPGNVEPAQRENGLPGFAAWVGAESLADPLRERVLSRESLSLARAEFSDALAAVFINTDNACLLPIVVHGAVFAMLGLALAAPLAAAERSELERRARAVAPVLERVYSLAAERALAGRVLRNNEVSLRLLSESIRDVVWSLDTETLRFTYVSPSVELLRGYTPEEVMAEPMDAALTPAAAAFVRDLIALRVAEFERDEERESPRRFYTEEVEQPCKDGSCVPTEVVTCFARDPRTGRVEAHGVTRDISARKRAQAASVEAAALERMLFDQAIQLIALLSTDGVLRSVNRTALDLAGTRLEYVVGRPFWETPWWRDGAAQQDWLRQAVARAAAGEVIRHEVTHRDRQGVVRSFDFSLKPLRDDAGSIISVIAESREISELARAVLERRTAEALYTALIDSLPGILYLYDAELRLRRWNRNHEHALGYSAAEVVGRSVRESICPESNPAAVAESFERVLRTGAPASLEALMLRKDGLGVPYLLTAARVDSPDGFMVAGVGLDITALKAAEAALTLSEARLRATLENTPNVAIQWYDGAGRICYWNRASETLYGWRSDEVLGEPYERTVCGPDGAAPFRQVLESVRATGRPCGPYEALGHRRDGTAVWILATAFALPMAGDETAVVCMDVDITERKRIEAEREALQAQLLQAQKLEAVGRLAGGVAHDFNNILGVILGQTELILEDLPVDSALRPDVEVVRDAAERSAELTRQLLAFARKQTTAPQVLALNQTVGGMLKMLRRLIGEEIELVWKPRARHDIVKLDPSQVDQVLANLCVNARDAIRGVGTITIETEDAYLDEAFCAEHVSCKPGHFVQLSVSDTGGGMTPEVVSRVFEPFFTTKGVGKGSGLGLAMVHGIVHQNAGAIVVHTELGHGSAFRLYLPRHVKGDAALARAAAQSHHPGRGETVLLVEDEPSLRVMSQTMLERLGYRVLPARLPSLALELAQLHPGNIHLLVTDVIMPEMNGRELLVRLRERLPALACLYISGYPADVIAHHGVLDSEVHFLPKPFSFGELAAKVSDVLSRERASEIPE